MRGVVASENKHTSPSAANIDEGDADQGPHT